MFKTRLNNDTGEPRTLVWEMESSNSATHDDARSAVSSFDEAEPTLDRIREDIS